MISVVIPLYNKHSCIESTVRSVLAQTYSDFELLVVNDGSTDDSAAVVDGISDARLRLVNKPNGGVSSARNEGIRQAKGEYVAFLDADDLYEPEFLQEVVELIAEYPEASIFGTSYWFLRDGVKVLAENSLPSGYKGMIDNRSWSLAHIYSSSSVCCRREVLVEVGMFDDRVSHGEDLDVWWRIMLRHPAAYSNRPLSVYRLDVENRAMNCPIPLTRLYINYFEKYAEDRAANQEFRHFIDRECMWWLFPYYARNPKDPDVQRILSQIDLSEYKFSFKFRFKHPYLYRIYKRLNH